MLTLASRAPAACPCLAAKSSIRSRMQVLLRPSLDDLQARVAARAAKGGHFMPASLLQSQLDALEPDQKAMEFGTWPGKLLASSNANIIGTAGEIKIPQSICEACTGRDWLLMLCRLYGPARDRGCHRPRTQTVACGPPATGGQASSQCYEWRHMTLGCMLTSQTGWCCLLQWSAMHSRARQASSSLTVHVCTRSCAWLHINGVLLPPPMAAVMAVTDSGTLTTAPTPGLGTGIGGSGEDLPGVMSAICQPHEILPPCQAGIAVSAGLQYSQADLALSGADRYRKPGCCRLGRPTTASGWRLRTSWGGSLHQGCPASRCRVTRKRSLGGPASASRCVRV